MNNTQKVICFTGGHLTPALSVIEEIESRNLPWMPIYIGRSYEMEGDTHESQESRIIRLRGIRFYSLVTGRLQRSFSAQWFLSFAKIPLGLLHAIILLLHIRPHLIMSFGGYIAVPVVIAGKMLRIPAITHEQTRVIGFGNRLIGKLVGCVCVSYKDQQETISAHTVYTGLPVRKSLFTPPTSPSFKAPAKESIIYVTGGSTGARSLNNLIYPLIPKLLESFTIIHQTGGRSYKDALQIRSALPTHLKERYIIHEYYDESDLAWIYGRATLIIGRAGANTVGELSVLGKIALLIPLPWSGNGEQQRNARYLAQSGSAVVLGQEAMTGERLMRVIQSIIKRKQEYQFCAQQLRKTMPTDAASRIVDEMRNYLS